MFGFIRRNKIKRAFEKNKRKHAFRSIETISQVLILFQPKDMSEVLLVASDLERLGKKTFLWTVESPDILEDKNNVASVRILRKDDFSKINILKAAVIEEFEGLAYDTLIDFSSGIGPGSKYLTYLLAINKAEFCIGCYENDIKGVYDLTILREKDQKILSVFDEMKLFLQHIKP